jgi:predicted amidohydrolase
MMKSLAAYHGAMIGGPYLAKRGDNVFNTYVLVNSNGAVHMHDKYLPTMVEHAYYIGGSDDGLVLASQRSVGIAVCWETPRTATVRRLRGKVDLLMLRELFLTEWATARQLEPGLGRHRHCSTRDISKRFKVRR